MITLIDASVAIKWFLHQERGRDRAVGVLQNVKNHPQDFAVPELFFNEMLAVLCRLLKDPIEITGHLGLLQDLGLVRLGNGRDTLSLAAELAKKFRLSGYDAIYAANAKLIKGTWLTADSRAHKKIANLRISRLL